MNISVKSILTLAVGILTLTAMSGCFTGIEKTPTIKNSSSSRSTAKQSPEKELLKNVSPQLPRDWQSGKTFIVTPGRLAYAYSPASDAASLRPGDNLRFYSMRSNVRLAGDTITEVLLLTPSGTILTTVIESPFYAIADKQLSLPFTIDADLVNEVKSILKGKTVWTLRANRDGKRYQRTQITDILPGSADFPFLVVTPNDSTLMLLNSRSSSARTFDNLFTLSDPRKQYPQISNKNWELICGGKIAVDMTREECRLALGAPAEIDRQTTYNGMIERWTYEDGRYLIFTDGLLTRFRI